jgi:hypothetical protein
MRFFRTALYVVTALCYIGRLSAQVNATGTLSGQATDPSGAAVADALEQQTGVSVTKTASADGYYTVPLIKPGEYSIKVEAPGFATMIRKGLVLQIQQVIQQDFKLQVGGVQQEVTVTNAPPLLRDAGTQDIYALDWKAP